VGTLSIVELFSMTLPLTQLWQKEIRLLVGAAAAGLAAIVRLGQVSLLIFTTTDIGHNYSDHNTGNNSNNNHNHNNNSNNNSNNNHNNSNNNHNNNNNKFSAQALGQALSALA
ncbi:unnamed protein product, partial [Polarella glacialis]